MMPSVQSPIQPFCLLRQSSEENYTILSSNKYTYFTFQGTGSQLSACSWIKFFFFFNLLLVLSVNNPTHMYLSDLWMYFKVQVYFRVTKYDRGVLKSQKKLVDYANTTNVEFLVDLKVLFHGWLIYSYFQIFKLIKCKWLPGECADWSFDNIMTWSYCLHRRYSMYTA